MREGVCRFKVPVYAYSITRNHVHVVVHACDREAVSNLMHLAAGSSAKWYNTRMDRDGSVWEHPYHCTIIQDGEHLLNCIRYVDLNMVRAGEVRHPANWPACGYDELTGKRKRYRIIDMEHLVARTGMQSAADFHAWYREGIERKLAEGRMEREGHWTESLAVGDRRFIDRMRCEYDRRAQFVTDHAPDGAWHVRETRTPYRTKNGP